jgi:hypothetical protein
LAHTEISKVVRDVLFLVLDAGFIDASIL